MPTYRIQYLCMCVCWYSNSASNIDFVDWTVLKIEMVLYYIPKLENRIELEKKRENESKENANKENIPENLILRKSPRARNSCHEYYYLQISCVCVRVLIVVVQVLCF